MSGLRPRASRDASGSVAEVDFLTQGDEDLVHVAFALDIHYLVVFPVMVGYGGRLFLVFGDTVADDLFVDVIGPAGGKAAVEQSFYEFVLADLEGQDDDDGGTLRVEQFVKGFGLGGGAGEAVEKEAVRQGIIVEGGADHLDDHLVRNELSFIHIALCCQPEGRLTGDLASKQIPGAEVLQAIFGDQSFRLCTLPATGRAE